MWRRIKAAYAFYQFHSLHLRSRRKIEAWQRKKLRELIPYLYDHIVVFRELLQSKNIGPSSIVELSDIEHLPVTGKELYRGRALEEYVNVTRSLSPYSEWITTSGTTGTPFEPLRRAISAMPYYGDSVRFRFLMKERPWAFDATWARLVYIRMIPTKRDNAIILLVQDFMRDPLSVVRQISEFHPDIIEGYSTIIYEIARLAREEGIPVRARYALAGSERLSRSAREFIEQEFHCEVFMRYGLEEFGSIAIECAHHNGYHINEESFIVEVVDPTGRTLPQGQYGKVVVTDLYNYDMPFVRYDTGDRGYISKERCPCGEETARLWFDGRYAAYLTFGERTFHEFEFAVIIEHYTAFVYQYQITKKSESHLLVRISIAPSFTDDVRQKLMGELSALVGPEIELNVERVDDISRLPRGKSQVIADESV